MSEIEILQQQLQAYKDKEKNMDDYIKELLEVNKDINNQLQAYKDKEDKLREYIEKEMQSQKKSIKLLSNKDYADIHIGKIAGLKEFLQILNEGSNDLEQQLQSYKEKEDKLRKVIESNLFIAYQEEQNTINICYYEELQQILNEGSDK